MNGDLEFQLPDKATHSTAEFHKVSQSFLAAQAERSEIQYATTSSNPTFPQYLMTVNAVQCAEAGVSVSSVLSLMRGYYGSVYASNFNQFVKQYRVIIRDDTNYRVNIAGLGKVQVCTGSDAMSPITEFVDMTCVYGPESVALFNLYSSRAVQGSPNVSYSTGQAQSAITATAAEYLPPGYGYEFPGHLRVRALYCVRVPVA